MLTFAEEIYLLSLDDASGKIALSGGRAALHRAIIGALLDELAFLGRIDIDIDHLFLVDRKPTGAMLLDDLLEVIASHGKRESTHYWLERLLPEAGAIEQLIADELVAKGILKMMESRFLWVFPSRRYPLINDREVLDVERRLRLLVLGHEIPTPRDAALFSLVYACDLLHEIFSPKELLRTQERIEMLAKLDLLGQEIIRAINELSVVVALPQQSY